MADGVDDAAKQAFTHGQRGNAACALDGVAFVDGAHFAKHNDADVVLLEVLHDALVAGVELHELAALGVVQTVDAGNAVAHGEHGAHLLQVGLKADVGQLFLQYCRYFGTAKGKIPYQRIIDLV